MNSIRLGVMLNQPIDAGGGYQQALNDALLAQSLSIYNVKVVFFSTIPENAAVLLKYGIDTEIISLTKFQRLRASLRSQTENSWILNILKILEKHSPLEGVLIKNKIDLVYFLSPSGWANTLEILSYIFTLWDMCHRDEPDFPEVRHSREFEKREKLLRSCLPRATAVLVDSHLSKTRVSNRYGIDQDRIYTMPFQASAACRKISEQNFQESQYVFEKYGLNTPYIFYPAQFWAHKNHVYLLEGLEYTFKHYGIRMGAIFSGTDKGNREYIQTYAREKGILEWIRFPGFVTDAELIELYRHSVAVVMPTYFGPTNLPPLEAFYLGVPVLYPDKVGFRDQVEEAALLIDLKDPGSMARHLKTLITDTSKRAEIVERGKNHLLKLESIDRVAILTSIIEEFRWKRLCWS